MPRRLAMAFDTYAKFLFAMAGVTYLLRVVPFILLKRELKSVFWKSFLNYIPYTVLSAMTVPAIFYSTESRLSGILALVTAVICSLLERGLVLVAIVACATVLLVDGVIL